MLKWMVKCATKHIGVKSKNIKSVECGKANLVMKDQTYEERKKERETAITASSTYRWNLKERTKSIKKIL